MPNSVRAATALGVKPSPHTLSRPGEAFSNTVTLAPPRAARTAAAAPAGPAPMTARSQREELTASIAATDDADRLRPRPESGETAPPAVPAC